MSNASESLNQAFISILNHGDKCPSKIPEINQCLEQLLKELQDAKDRPQPIENDKGKNHESQKKQQKERFDFKKCKAYKQLTDVIFYPTIRQSELVSIATVLAGRVDLRVDRDAKRRKDLLIKWYDDHWDLISPHLSKLVAFNKEGDVLNRGGSKGNVQDAKPEPDTDENQTEMLDNQES